MGCVARIIIWVVMVLLLALRRGWSRWNLGWRWRRESTGLIFIFIFGQLFMNNYELFKKIVLCLLEAIKSKLNRRWISLQIFIIELHTNRLSRSFWALNDTLHAKLFMSKCTKSCTSRNTCTMVFWGTLVTLWWIDFSSHSIMAESCAQKVSILQLQRKNSIQWQNQRTAYSSYFHATLV